MWVGTAAGPIGGDDLHISLRIEPKASLVVGSTGAAIVLPGPDAATSTLLIDVTLNDDASLVWYTQPTVIAAGARHRVLTTIELGAGSDLIWVEELVLGRHLEQPGTLSTRLVVDGPSGPVLRTGTEIGEHGWDGPAVLGGRRAISQVLLVGAPARRWAGFARHDDSVWAATTELSNGERLVTVIAAGAREMRAVVAEVVAASHANRAVPV
jgi:urease accessory protein